MSQKRQSTVCLGIQANLPDLGPAFMRKVYAWAPLWATGFHLVRFEHTDYSGRKMLSPTGYGRFEVTFFSSGGANLRKRFSLDAQFRSFAAVTQGANK